MKYLLFTVFVLFCFSGCKNVDLGPCDCLEEIDNIINRAKTYDDLCTYEVTLASNHPECLRYTFENSCSYGITKLEASCLEVNVDLEETLDKKREELGSFTLPEGFKACYGLENE